LNACKIVGLNVIRQIPIENRVANQTIIIGANVKPIFDVPNICTTKSTIRTQTVIGKIHLPRLVEVVAKPSTADITLIAGVNAPSPINNDAARIETILTICFARARNRLFSPVNKPQRANVPPSPRLSAMRINTAYLIVTRIIKFQIINETTPMHCDGVGCLFSSNIVGSTYNGLVPISPNIIPSEPTVNEKNKPKFFRGDMLSVSSTGS